MTVKKDRPVNKVKEKRQAYTAAPDKTKHLTKTIEDLRKSNSELANRVKLLEERLAKVESALPDAKTNACREISREEAEKEIMNLFSEGETLYYSDIAGRLDLELPAVVDICNDLLNRGEIKVNDDSLQPG
jgi:hypothetical protein